MTKQEINTPHAPSAIGPYSQAIEAGGLVFTSGQLPTNPATGQFPNSIQEQTRQTLQNIQSILEAAGLTMQNVVKTTVMLSSIGDFNAMNEVYAEFFEPPYPARCCYAVKDIPKGALLEIEVVAAR